jgi:predicted  nucleic acid-binding Zn-ribbon protein
MKTTPMPESEPFADLRQKLDGLNRLEDERTPAQLSGRSTLDGEALIESLRANVPLNVLLQHDRLRARGKRSVADLRQGVCSGCHMSQPSGTVLEVKRESALVKCDYCGRFLFLADGKVDSAVMEKRSRHASKR